MEDLLSKLTTYNIFNYLLPGAVFVFVCRQIDIYSFQTESIIIEFFLYYFVGMTISRLGSLIIEPVFKKMGVVEYAPYSDYLNALAKDPKIELLLETNNTYRTIASLFLCILSAVAAVHITAWLLISQKIVGFVLAVLMSILYIFAYRKQTAYIRKRVEHQARK